jgi:3-oxoacyl-[acyl-carrier protein] reductase
MNYHLNGRIAIVTGGSKGIGRAIARSLLEEGAKVTVCARNPDDLGKMKREFNGISPDILTVAADATRWEDAERVVAETVQYWGGLDILVNNVGGAVKFAGFFDLEEADWSNTFQLNVMSMVHFSKMAIPWLRQSTQPRIINVSSISGLEPGTFNPHYTAMKAATINLSKYLSNMLAQDKIPVNVVCPGPVYSESWSQNVERIAGIRGISPEEAKAQVDAEESEKIPMGVVGSGADVAGLVAYLASEQAAWITGSCFHINGGKLRSMC